jgi:pyruvate/2-oxoglutarate/acetoin dehydrogenase E1 component
VLFLEPKDLYRVRHDANRPLPPSALLKAGPRLPGEVPCSDEDGIPAVDTFAIPFGKAKQVSTGDDCTVVAYGIALHKAMAAARALAGEGVHLDVWDLRTLVPYDREAILASVRRTGRLVVATEDRAFASLARQIQADMTESVPGLVSRVASMEEVPSPGMAPSLFRATVLSPEKVADTVREVLSHRAAPSLRALDNELFWLQHAPSFHKR